MFVSESIMNVEFDTNSITTMAPATEVKVFGTGLAVAFAYGRSP